LRVGCTPGRHGKKREAKRRRRRASTSRKGTPLAYSDTIRHRTIFQRRTQTAHSTTVIFPADPIFFRVESWVFYFVSHQSNSSHEGFYYLCRSSHGCLLG
jgi:hypothetical protein